MSYFIIPHAVTILNTSNPLKIKWKDIEWRLSYLIWFFFYPLQCLYFPNFLLPLCFCQVGKLTWISMSVFPCCATISKYQVEPHKQTYYVLHIAVARLLPWCEIVHTQLCYFLPITVNMTTVQTFKTLLSCARKTVPHSWVHFQWNSSSHKTYSMTVTEHS